MSSDSGDQPESSVRDLLNSLSIEVMCILGCGDGIFPSLNADHLQSEPGQTRQSANGMILEAMLKRFVSKIFKPIVFTIDIARWLCIQSH